MFLNYKVPVPEAPGKLVRKKRNGQTYLEYEYDRSYDPAKQYTYPKRASIGRIDPDDPGMMTPNENYLKYFSHESLPEKEEQDRTDRSPFLKMGTYVVLQKLIRESRLQEMLSESFHKKETGLLLDLASYSIITGSNAAQYYPDYAYEHALFTEDMKIYSDTKISSFFRDLKPEQITGFLNSWNKNRDKQSRIYISYDATNKNSQAGDLDIVEFGKPKINAGLPIFNYSVAFDTNNNEPLFYEQYPGSINDISQLKCMVDKAYGYGYRNIGFILDRGYFSKENLKYMDKKGYAFLVMVKGLKDFVRDTIIENQGTFENKRIKYIEKYDDYGMTVKKPLYEGDEKARYIHIYYSDGKAYAEKQVIKQKIRSLKIYLDKCVGTVCSDFGDEVKKLFYLHYEKDGKTLKLAEENTQAVEKELSLAGYFVIASSDKLTAREALELYKSRDTSEKLFRADKSYLGNKNMRVESNEALCSKIFVEFLALMLRNKLYGELKKKCEEMAKKPNYMTVPEAIKELEKIVLIRHLDGTYRLDHAVIKTQKNILDAFGLKAGNITYGAKEIGNTLMKRE